MKRTTCEYMMWSGLPVIRKGFAESLINDFGLSQKDTAEKLGVTPAAICQYLSKKRGGMDITNKVVLKEIKVSAQNIIDNSSESIISETCRICKILRASGEFNLFCPSCDD